LQSTEGEQVEIKAVLAYACVEAVFDALSAHTVVAHASLQVLLVLLDGLARVGPAEKLVVQPHMLGLPECHQCCGSVQALSASFFDGLTCFKSKSKREAASKVASSLGHVQEKLTELQQFAKQMPD
jgi:hypothetical protein